MTASAYSAGENWAAAAELWEQAAALGHVPSYAALAQIYYEGRSGVARWYDRAAELAAMGADKGCGDCKVLDEVHDVPCAETFPLSAHNLLTSIYTPVTILNLSRQCCPIATCTEQASLLPTLQLRCSWRKRAHRSTTRTAPCAWATCCNSAKPAPRISPPLPNSTKWHRIAAMPRHSTGWPLSLKPATASLPTSAGSIAAGHILALRLSRHRCAPELPFHSSHFSRVFRAAQLCTMAAEKGFAAAQ